MEEILIEITKMVEAGKVDRNTPFPSELRGKDGASELTLKALQNGIDPQIILNNGLIPGMNNIGDKFSRGEAYIPNMLVAAKAMNAALEHLKPYLASGVITSRGRLVLGTVHGDLHDIGKNLVKMIMKSDGWEVIDLGTDVSCDKFVKAVEENPDCIVGLSALLTTTMLNMEDVVKALKEKNSDTKIFIGGAPVSMKFAERIGADGYFSNPRDFALHFHS